MDEKATTCIISQRHLLDGQGAACFSRRRFFFMPLYCQPPFGYQLRILLAFAQPAQVRCSRNKLQHHTAVLTIIVPTMMLARVLLTISFASFSSPGALCYVNNITLDITEKMRYCHRLFLSASPRRNLSRHRHALHVAPILNIIQAMFKPRAISFCFIMLRHCLLRLRRRRRRRLCSLAAMPHYLLFP